MSRWRPDNVIEKTNLFAVAQSVFIRVVLAFAVMCVSRAIPSSAEDVPRPPPEAASGINNASALVSAQNHVVAAAEPLAAEAARDILRKGGSAIDAAIAAEMVLGLVEPQSSGLGGGAFIVQWDAKSRSLTTFDGRETAPEAAKPDRFLASDGKPLAFEAAVLSGRSVGVPGLIRVLYAAHEKSGRLPWASLFEVAIKLADEGFPVSPRLAMLLGQEKPEHFAPEARSYFYDATGQPLAAGANLKNPDYAATLKAIAAHGPDAFYKGEIADAIAKAVCAAPGGDLTRADLEGYAAKERPAVCFAYRERLICGMGPPSSGALTIGQILKLIAPFKQVQGPAQLMAPEALNTIAEAEKLAYADRNRYIADPDRIPVPSGLLDDEYLAERRKLIVPDKSILVVEPGLPPGLAKKTFGVDATREAYGTTHMSIIDNEGNAVSMTASIESAFGSHLWSKGFLLNGELTDFSFLPVDAEGVAIANAIEGGKRPRSSMAPTIVLGPDGAPEIVTGSPGGSQIILYVVKTLVAMLDWGLDAQKAAALANFGSLGGALLVEASTSVHWPVQQLTSFGQAITTTTMTSGVNTVTRRNGRLQGGADPRRQGVVLGD
jgi:gamma-glutamyltranspeptidase / glutathione hydrolase